MVDEIATADKPATSPSGKYVLAVIADDATHTQSFQILDRNKTVVYDAADRFEARHVTFFLWGPEDRVWVYSGDVGTYFWESQGDPRRWERHVYADSAVPAPSFLKQVRPRYHQK